MLSLIRINHLDKPETEKHVAAIVFAKPSDSCKHCGCGCCVVAGLRPVGSALAISESSFRRFHQGCGTDLSTVMRGMPWRSQARRGSPAGWARTFGDRVGHRTG